MKKREKSALFLFFANIYTVTISSLLPFIVRTVLVRYMGMEYAGVSSLFTSILQVLNVADFGLSSALVYYLYKPAEENDTKLINTYMSFFKKIFHCVGVIIFVAGIAILPFLHVLVKGKEYPTDLNIYVIYMSYVLQASLPYLLNFYIVTLLYAHLKGYVDSLIAGTSLLFMYVLQIFSIIVLKNYYLFTLLLVIEKITQALIYIWCKKKFFPWLKYNGNVSLEFKKDFKKNLVAMMLSKLRIISRNSFDSIVVSIFFGLTVLAKYQNYYQIMIVPLMIIYMLRQSIQPSLGNGIVSENMESNYGIVKQYLFLNNFVSTICIVCLLSLIQPFMKLWMGSENLLNVDIVVCISVYFYMLSVAEANVLFREATGVWKEGKWISILESISNIVLNVFFAWLFGLWGIVLASILTVAFINIPLESYYVFSKYFKGKYWDFIRLLLKYTLITGFITIISYIVCMKIEVINYGTMILRILASVAFPAVCFIAVHHKDREFFTTKEFILDIVKKMK